MENKNEIQKTQVFNVIILDRSGSMNRIRKAAVDGFNETLAGIKKAQEKFADTQDHFVTLVTFCSCEMNSVFNKVPVAEARPLREEDYVPCCCTPLYDAMGITLNAMRKHVKDMDDVAEIGSANHLSYEKKQESERKRRDAIPEGECIYFDEAYERGMRLLGLELSKLDVNMFGAVNNSLINDGCGLFRGRMILPYEHLSRFQNDIID